MAGLVELATPTVDADPGEESEVGILVYNTGVADEAFDLEVIGSPAPWAFLDPAIVRIPAGGAGTARLVLRPPKSCDIPAGPMPFSIRLSARNEPDRDEIADGTLDIAPFEAFTARLVPDVFDVGLVATTKVEVTNDGNVPIVVQLTPNSPDGELSFKADEEAVMVPAGTTAEVNLRIHPKRRRLFGKGEPTLFTVRLESLVRVATLSGRVRPKGAALWLLARAGIAVLLGAGLAYGWQALPHETRVATTSKGLPLVLKAMPDSPDTLPDEITGVKEPSPLETVTTAPPVTAAGPATSVSTPGTLPAPPVEVRGDAKSAPLRRFYDPAVVDYLYTSDNAEAQRLITAGLVEQGTAGSILTARAKGSVPLYRLKRGDGRHLFTYDEAERRNEVVRGGAVQEGIAGYLFPNPTAGTTPLYRMVKDGVAYLTVDQADVATRQQNGWTNDGVRGYVLT